MLDIKYIRENPTEVVRRLAAKGTDAKADVDRILELDARRREMIGENEAKKAQQNRVSKQIPQMKKEGADTAPVFAQMKELSAQIKENDEKLAQVEAEYNTLLLGLPNLPDPDLAPGGKENNEPIRYFG